MAPNGASDGEEAYDYVSNLTPPLSLNVTSPPPPPLLPDATPPPPPNVHPDVVPEETNDNVYEKIIEALKGTLNQQQMGIFAQKLAESHGTYLLHNTAMATIVPPQETPSELYQEFQPVKPSHPQAIPINPTINPRQQLPLAVPQTQLLGQEMYEDATTSGIEDPEEIYEDVYDVPDPQTLDPVPRERMGK